MKYRKGAPFGESGFTLQTLIVTAVVVVVAIGVGLLLFALTSSSSEDLEDAGRRGDDAACAPNEALDAVYVRRGFGGPEGRGGVRSKSVGCKPYCATWEFVAELSEDGEKYVQGSLALLAGKEPIGGPDGAGDVFSSNIGCFAPCYWENVGSGGRMHHTQLTGEDYIASDNSDANPGQTARGLTSGPINPSSRLRYYDDNEPPEAGVIRLGVTYRRVVDPNQGTDFMETELNRTDSDVKPFYTDEYVAELGYTGGVNNAPGTRLSPEQIARGVPTVHEPNWYSPRNNVLASSEWGRFNTYGEDEDWEVRADPENEVCEIVYTPTDRLICSSDNESCRESNISLGNCPQTLGGRIHDFADLPVCRLP